MLTQQIQSMSLPRATYSTILLGSLAWCAALFLAPMFTISSPALHGAADFLYKFFHPICHQLDDRSFHMFGQPLAVCARCSSIYLAFLLGTILYPLLSGYVVPSRLMLALSVVPMLMDVVAGALGLHEVTNLTRAMTGAFFGIALPFFVIPTITEAMTELTASSAHQDGTQPINHHVQKGPSHA